ncbi:molybdenum cofactor biosynthesis protein MoaE [Fimbriimonas ginsengisoli]|uniref:Molybdopterin converting factor, subunit 2 n=1 Tax=Fimbriimonas ginsengisoli Gsoil 348 TaxID=661478 RepID=A0A068NQY7_FIMGI|nr:molybdenum cofactor biosynthesis protein MoaE [Fimbriimonas ginsengisoli]AIE85958.1 molybdopterin converting factor, subunit 2 [Fimbriimonas ginsengisoli Gsoil 348]
MSTFAITSEPIPGRLLPDDVSVGGIVIFEGRVRDLNEGQQVQALEYEAYEALALREGETILEEARARFPILGLACTHRIGLLQLGDVAIRVEAAAAHRREAFEACEWVVDEVKRRVPIWKKEHYVDGPSEWINASGAPSE